MITACEKEKEAATATIQTTQAEDRSPNQVTICHHSVEDNSWHVIQINANAWPAHQAHGDAQLVDADNDGYVAAENHCVPGDDCNDGDASIHPGAEEVCGDNIDNNCNGQTNEGCCNYFCFNEETLNGGSDYYFYYDTEISDCLGIYNVAYLACPQFIAYATAQPGQPQAVQFVLAGEGSTCVKVVGEGEGYISQADFDCSMALLRAFIAAHPEIPNYCGPGLKSGSGSSGMVRPEDLFKNLMPEGLRKKLNKQ